MKTWFDRAREMEQDPRVLQASPFPMQPWLDVAEGGWAVVVTTDGDRGARRKPGRRAGRSRLVDARRVPEEGGRQHRRGRAPGRRHGRARHPQRHGRHGLRRGRRRQQPDPRMILRQGIKGRALIPMIAPEAVAKLAQAGVGAEVTLPLGGHATSFLQASDRHRHGAGRRRRGHPGGEAQPARGRSWARRSIFETGPVTMLMTELRAVAGNLPERYRALGVEPDDYQMVVLKTASNFQYFQPIASGVIRVDTTGPGPVGYRHPALAAPCRGRSTRSTRSNSWRG